MTKVPTAPDVPTTLKDHGTVHEVTMVQLGKRSMITDKWFLRFETACGWHGFVDDKRAFNPKRAVSCIACIAHEVVVEPKLRGETADLVIYDEVQDFKPDRLA
jgi:hypothetical protein